MAAPEEIIVPINIGVGLPGDVHAPQRAPVPQRLPRLRRVPEHAHVRDVVQEAVRELVGIDVDSLAVHKVGLGAVRGEAQAAHAARHERFGHRRARTLHHPREHRGWARGVEMRCDKLRPRYILLAIGVIAILDD